MLDLIEKNKEMLANKQYKLADERDMLKISSLTNVNDYDLYLIACCLCNYPIEEKKDAMELRMKYFLATDHGKIDGYEHAVTDYKKVVTSITCTNTCKVNKYGLYEYEVNINDRDLTSDLWNYKGRCLKYIDSKTYPDKIVISISRDQLENFKQLLDKFMISWDVDNIEEGLFYKNKSRNTLIDFSKLSLPFEPYDYQVEDATKIVSKKRLLIGHEMGCFTGNTMVILSDGSKVKIKDLVDKGTFTVRSYDTETKQFVTSTAISKKTRLNAELIKVIYNNKSALDNKTYEVLCTPDHKFLTDNGWVEAKDLKSFDKLISENNTTEVIGIEPINHKEDVYCLTVENTHTFLIDGNIVVHNCGKTFISVLVGSSINMPKLVICPESLRLNWFREIKNVTPEADVQVQLSNEEPHFGKDWTIIGYATVNKFLDELLSFNCVFVDECHACKSVNNYGSPSSKRASAVVKISENAEFCYLLSGTPMPSHNKDLFNILRMLKCESFDFNSRWAFKNFADKFCDPKEGFFGTDYSGNSNSSILHDILSNIMVRRLKKDVLPNLKKQRQFIPIEPKFKKDYLSIEKRLYKPNKDDTYMGLAMTGRQLLSNYKIDTAIDLAESLIESGENVVLVTNFIESADVLKAHFKDKACEIRGGLSDTAKQKAIDDFQSKKVPVCILNMQAGGVGITLTAAHTMIIVDYAWLPSDMIQVEDRICRSGQTESCIIYYIYCINSTLDSTFISMISEKSENIDRVIDDSINTFNLAEEKDTNATFINTLKAKIRHKEVS